MTKEAPSISVVIGTLGRPTLGRVLDRLAVQSVATATFEVLVVADATTDPAARLDAMVAGRPYRARLLCASLAGASAARNIGVEAAGAELVLFIGDDTLPTRDLLAEHLEWHRRHPQTEIGVLGRVRWADGLRVTPFMRWLEDGIQFDYPNIRGTDAGWARFYTANASVKRDLVQRVGGFAERELPFLYEDLDLALRMHEHGFRLLYNAHAVAEHLHAVDLAGWGTRAAAIARAERAFVGLHPGFEPYFHRMFSAAAAAPPISAPAARLAAIVPRRLPLLGPIAWARADHFYRQTLAEPFLQAWERAEGAPSAAGHVP